MSIFGSIRSWFGSPEVRTGNTDLDALQILIGYRFKDIELLELGLTHRSFNNSANKRHLSNERLEFLGDSVLGLAIAEFLYRDHPDLQEGELTKTKALMVNETTLANIGCDSGLAGFILLSAEEDRAGGRERPSIISDAVESVIGAVYLDGGMPAARDVIFRIIYTHKEEILADASQRNFKGELLELMQSRGDGMPFYNVISEEGPDHHKLFTVEVLVSYKTLGKGEGHSKKEAEQKAAADALLALGIE